MLFFLNKIIIIFYQKGTPGNRLEKNRTGDLSRWWAMKKARVSVHAYVRACAFACACTYLVVGARPVPPVHEAEQVELAGLGRVGAQQEVVVRPRVRHERVARLHTEAYL